MKLVKSGEIIIGKTRGYIAWKRAMHLGIDTPPMEKIEPLVLVVDNTKSPALLPGVQHPKD